jgi:hypothetical protein
MPRFPGFSAGLGEARVGAVPEPGDVDVILGGREQVSGAARGEPGAAGLAESRAKPLDTGVKCGSSRAFRIDDVQLTWP